jgi:hypothetical protein
MNEYRAFATPRKTLLGFEVPTGEPVHITPQHLAIFGMTQLSGKTTTLEALINRSGLRGIAFITKRGEAGFTEYNKIPAFYKERVDWRYVESLLNTALGEKVKYEPKMRYAIMRVARGSKTLRQVYEKAKKYHDQAKSGWDKEVYDKLGAYLDLVLPEIEGHEFAHTVELENGINVMDLADMKLETQQLIIASTVQYIYENLANVIVIVPEAWEMLPQSRMTPVKWIVEQFIRKGASIGNYLWVDSQDIGGIDKTPLRQVSTWLMGRMMEAHEVERIIKQLLGVKITKAQIQTLALGHFFVVTGNQVKLAYVLPVGIPEDIGRKVATGSLAPETIMRMLNKIREDKTEEPNIEALEERIENAHARVTSLQTQFRTFMADMNESMARLHEKADTLTDLQEARAKIDLTKQEIAITVKKARKTLALDQTNVLGRIAILYEENLLPNEWFTKGRIRTLIQNRFSVLDPYPNITKALDELTFYGYLQFRKSGVRPEYKPRISATEAKEKGLITGAP